MDLPFAHEPCPTAKDLAAHAHSIAEAIARAQDRPDEPWAPGKWTRRQLACHIADTEVSLLDRLRRVLAEHEPALANIPEDAWAAATGTRSPLLAAELFRSARAACAELLHLAPATAWQRRGLHSSLGWMRLEDIARHVHYHALHHVRQLQRHFQAPITSTGKTRKKTILHQATLHWHNPDAQCGSRFTRVHQWEFDGHISLRASASPAVVPLPYSAAEAIDPEEALVAAAASCLMLTFLWLAHQAGFTAAKYHDHAVGEMSQDPDGGYSVQRIVLRPNISWHGVAPDAQTLEHLHHQAHQQCYIARSVRSEIVVETPTSTI